MSDKIKQPKNVEIKAQKAEVNLAWRNTFGKDSTQKFDTAQEYVDSQCIELMKRYTPEVNHILVKSPVWGTKIGSGHIVYESSYARYQYYGNVMVSTGGKGSKKIVAVPERQLKYSKAGAQRLWFEVMKKQHGEAILRGAARIAGGKPK